MGLKADLQSEVADIFRSRWDERDGTVVPEDDDIGLGNDAVRLEGTVLYADIDGSTNMVDSQTPSFAAEVYKTYLLCASRIIKAEGGVITAYDGDRVMAVFIGASKNTSAVRCGLKINGAAFEIINPAIKKQYSTDFQLRQTVGIDTSNLFIARTGIRGSNDLVWVGRAANYAAKFSSFSEDPYVTFISEGIYDHMHDSVKFMNGTNMWQARTWRGKTVYRSCYYFYVPN